MRAQVSNSGPHITFAIKLLSALYIIIIIGLFFYSYTQVDLGLTLTRHPFFYSIQRAFQYIGYFNRPLSTYFYAGILILLHIFYGIFVWAAWKNKISSQLFWILTAVQTGILFFSYSAFSYDIFNYIFDARIVTNYHQNPYLHSALDFPSDPMLSFMHWTQRKYPYGPIWLVLTVPLSIIGLQYFLLTFFLFKGLAAASYFISSVFIWKLLSKTTPKEKIIGSILFSMNPLVLIESLVSAHIDVESTVFTLFAIFMFINKKYIRSFIILIIGFGIKFISIFIFPVLLYQYLFKNRKYSNWQKIYLAYVIFMIIPVILETVRTNFQPWYILSFFPFLALLGKNLTSAVILFVMSFFSLIQYIPFLWTGNWNPPIPTVLFLLTASGILLSLFCVCLFKIKNMLQ